MADALHELIKIHRSVYTLRTPTNAIEVDKMLRWAFRDVQNMAPELASYDDWLKIESNDEEITAWFEYTPKATS